MPKSRLKSLEIIKPDKREVYAKAAPEVFQEPYWWQRCSKDIKDGFDKGNAICEGKKPWECHMHLRRWICDGKRVGKVTSEAASFYKPGEKTFEVDGLFNFREGPDGKKDPADENFRYVDPKLVSRVQPLVHGSEDKAKEKAEDRRNRTQKLLFDDLENYKYTKSVGLICGERVDARLNVSAEHGNIPYVTMDGDVLYSFCSE